MEGLNLTRRRAVDFRRCTSARCPRGIWHTDHRVAVGIDEHSL